MCTKTYSVLISFHKGIVLQSCEFGLNDVIPTNVRNISHLGFLAFYKLLSIKSFICANLLLVNVTLLYDGKGLKVDTLSSDPH